MANLVLPFIVTFLAFTVSIGDAIRCYQCSSDGGDYSCGDPFYGQRQVAIVECDNQQRGSPGYPGPSSQYGNQPYGNQQYGNQQYGNQQFGQQYGGNQQSGGQQYGGQQYYGGNARSVCKKTKTRQPNGQYVVRRSCAFEYGYGNGDPCASEYNSGLYSYGSECSVCRYDACNGAAAFAPAHWVLAATAMFYFLNKCLN